MKLTTQSATKFSSTLLVPINLGIGVWAVALGIISVTVSQSVSAQIGIDVEPLAEFEAGQNERDSFSGTSGFSPFELIHRARLGNIGNLDEYADQQREQLRNAASEFRLQQLELLKKQSQLSPESSPETSDATKYDLEN